MQPLCQRKSYTSQVYKPVSGALYVGIYFVSWGLSLSFIGGRQGSLVMKGQILHHPHCLDLNLGSDLYQVAMWPWASLSPSLGLSSFMCKVRTTAYGYCEDKRGRPCKAQISAGRTWSAGQACAPTICSGSTAGRLLLVAHASDTYSFCLVDSELRQLLCTDK